VPKIGLLGFQTIRSSNDYNPSPDFHHGVIYLASLAD